jgi:competence protein ComEA
VPDLDPRRLVVTALLVVAVAALGVRELVDGGAREAGPAASVALDPATSRASPSTGGPGVAARAEGDDGRRVAVHVAGAVRRPGVYRLPVGARVDDAVRSAGGAGRRADLSAVNLAARVEDGRQVVVPTRLLVDEAMPGGGRPAPGGPTTKVNLNTATIEQLDELDGVGPAIAGKIVAYREEHGGFGSPDELAEVPGIGDRRLAALRPLVTV